MEWKRFTVDFGKKIDKTFLDEEEKSFSQS
jgi:hypothetical protein